MKIEPLGPQHDRGAFSCGVAQIDEFLFACSPEVLSPDDRIYVAVDADGAVLGFYGLRAAIWEVRSGKSVKHRHAELELSMMGVRHDRQSQGIGAALANDAFERVLDVVGMIGGIQRLWLGALNARAQRFYERTGFSPLGDSLRMVILIDEIADALSAAE